MVVEIVDTEDRIRAFLPRLEQLVGSALVTLEALRMFRCGRQTHGVRRASDVIFNFQVARGPRE